jgi:hypothetical protein
MKKIRTFKIIDQIAFRTNLLALNTAITAASSHGARNLARAEAPVEPLHSSVRDAQPSSRSTSNTSDLAMLAHALRQTSLRQGHAPQPDSVPQDEKERTF